MPEPPQDLARLRAPSRGISAADVDRAADALLREGRRPTIERVRERLGTGSPNTINPLLDTWWRRLAARLDAGPAALHRLPESIAHIAEALWMQALDEGRRRAAQEAQGAQRHLVQDRQQLEVRSHVLTLREGELESRLRDRERTLAALEAQLRELTVLMRKERATRDSLTRRIAALEADLAASAKPLPKPRMPRAPNKRRGRPTRKPAASSRKVVKIAGRRKPRARPNARRR